MNPQIQLIDTYEDLLARPNFRASLPFHPKVERRFGAVVAPYRFMEKIPCGIEACHTPHFSGYLITTDDGLETAIGSHCGRNHFGMSFTRERQRVEQAVAHYRRVKSVQAMLDDMAKHLLVIERLEKDYKDLQDKKMRLIGAIGSSVFTVLKTRADRGQPQITKEVPMTREEADAFFATSNRKAGDGKGWPTKSVPLATLEGLDFIKARFKDMLVVTLITPMRELSKQSPADIEQMKPRHLTATAKWAGEVPRSIEQAEAIITAGYRFFRADNIERLVHLGASASDLSAMVNDLKAEDQAKK